MKNKKNKIVFIIGFTIFSFLSGTGICGFSLISNYELPTVIPAGKIVTENEASGVEVNQQKINSILNAKVKYIEFSDSKKYHQERDIVYKATNMAESEKYSEGSMKKAFIRIALEDLNDDGNKEVLAYIMQFAWCGRGGGYCTFLILQKKSDELWEELFRKLAYPGIGIANTKSGGYHDIFFRDIIFRVGDKQKVKDREEVTVWRWDDKKYSPYVKSEAIYDPATKIEKKTLMRWDVESSSWKIIERR